MPVFELKRFLKEIFRDNGEELSRFGCAVLVNECRLISGSLFGQGFKLTSQNARPRRVLGSRRQDWGAVRKAVFLVELMREFMERHIPPLADCGRATQDMIPREHHSPSPPGDR